jgi:hypothetical protein
MHLPNASTLVCNFSQLDSAGCGLLRVSDFTVAELASARPDAR